MEENAKIELDLSEEQLQAITGGCDQCQRDERVAASHDRWAKKYNKKVANNWDKYINTPNPTEADVYHTKYERYERLATSEENAATELRNQIAARHA